MFGLRLQAASTGEALDGGGSYTELMDTYFKQNALIELVSIKLSLNIFICPIYHF